MLEEAKKRDHRRLGAGARPLQHRRGPRRRPHPLAPQGRPDPGRHRGLLARAALGGRLRHRLHPPYRHATASGRPAGHLGFYKDSMYSPMDIDGQNYYLKPMNCPFHIQIYKSRMRSYRDLPLRWAELGTVYRYERSGTLHGLLRVRGFTQDDAHIFCTPGPDRGRDPPGPGLLHLHPGGLRLHGQQDRALRPRPEEPGQVRRERGAVGPGRGRPGQGPRRPGALPTSGWRARRVFYGPKIDIKIKDAIGRFWQCTTIQFDFNMSERFDMTYIGEDGQSPSALHGPPGPARLPGAVLRDPHRALRGSFPGLAGPGPGDRPADRRPPRGLRPRARRKLKAARPPRGRRLSAGRRSTGRSARPSSRRSLSSSSSGTRRRPTGRPPSASTGPATGARSTCPSSWPRPGSSSGIGLWLSIFRGGPTFLDVNLSIP